MSASEELRKLDEVVTDLSLFGGGENVEEITSKGESAKGMVALRNALPEIIAVVEAAEQVEDPSYYNVRNLRRQLSDLEKTLMALKLRLRGA